MTEDDVVSALVAGSTCWDDELQRTQVPAHRRKNIIMEALAWQGFSQNGAEAELWAQPMPFNRKRSRNGREISLPKRGKRPPREPNRLMELMGLMGAIGEQLGLAWTFEQDVQRYAASGDARAPEHQRLIQRALAESAGHFTLGASHSLANLVLRLLLLNADAAKELNTRYRRALGFPPGSDARSAWQTLNRHLAGELHAAATVGDNRFMLLAADVICDLQSSPAFAALDDRRGMDYHRRRPQSVRHVSPRRDAITLANGLRTMSMFGAQLEPEADADRVHQIVVSATGGLRVAMREIRSLLPKAIRAERIAFIVA